MTIDELLSAVGLTANDEIPIWDAEATGEQTKKITAQQLAAAVVTLAAVARSGDTMTGDLTVANSGESNVASKCTNSDITVYLTSHYSGFHGVYSSGYNSGDGFVADGKYLIARRPNGEVVVLGHYNKNEVNALGVLYTDVNIGNVTVNASGYMDITGKIPSGITPIAALIQDFNTATGAITVTANGKYILGTPNATVTGVTIRYYYRGQ